MQKHFGNHRPHVVYIVGNSYSDARDARVPVYASLRCGCVQYTSAIHDRQYTGPGMRTETEIGYANRSRLEIGKARHGIFALIIVLQFTPR